jgi:REP element-mobilizing transposase RayT
MTIERPFGGAKLMRAGRCSLVGQIYLITACTQHREPLFTDLKLARAVIEEFRLAESERKVRSLSFVVMPDHFHWLIRLGQVSDLSGIVKQVKARSAQSINRAIGRAGRIWQRGFHDRAVRRDQDLRSVARYVVANPLRAGLVEDIGKWPHWDAVWLESGGRTTDVLEP